MRFSTLAWSLCGLLLLVFGGSRILAGLGDREVQVRRQLSALVEAIQEDDQERVRRFVSRSYMDEDTGTERRDLRSALRDGGGDLVPEIDAATWIEFLPSRDGGSFDSGSVNSSSVDRDRAEETCTVRVKVLLRKGALGQPAEPYWNFEAELDLRLERGSWKIFRSRGVNLDQRGKA